MKLLSAFFLSLFWLHTSAQWLLKHQVNYALTEYYATGKVVVPDSNNIRTIGWEREYDNALGFGIVKGNLKIQYSNDGGNTFQFSKPVIDISNRFLIDIFCVNKDTTFVITSRTVYQFLQGIPSSIIYKSVQGVDSFLKVSTNGMFLDSGLANFIYFFDNKNGCVVGDPNYDTTNRVQGKFFEIYTTQNSGGTWDRVLSNNIPKPLNEEFAFGGIVSNTYTTIGNTIWFVTSSRRVFKSLDRGKTWNAYIITPPKNYAITHASIAFKDSLNGLAGFDDRIYKTSDGGITWEEGYNMTLPPRTNKFNPANLQYIKGTQGLYIGTSDRLETLTYKSGLGVTYYSYDGLIWKPLATTLNGNNKNKISLSAVCFTNPNNGWIGGFDASIYKWGGKKLPPNFTIQNPVNGTKLLCGKTYLFNFNSTDTGAANVEVSTDNGTTWTLLELAVKPGTLIQWKAPLQPATCRWKMSTIYDSAYNNISNQYAIELPQISIVSPTGGQVLSQNKEFSIVWSSSNLDSVNVYYTADSGVTWIPIALGTPSSGNYKWTTPMVSSSNCAIRITALYDTKYFAQTPFFTIKNTTGIREVVNSLVKVFPNPTNGIVNIDSQQPIKCIAVYDLSGKQLIGAFSNTIDCKQLKSGMYILKVELVQQGEITLKLLKED